MDDSLKDLIETSASLSRERIRFSEILLKLFLIFNETSFIWRAI